MKRRLRSGGAGWLEDELRRGRPEPRDEFVRQLSGRISTDSRRRPALGLRVAFAASFASLIVVALAAFGGIGYAASAANSIARTAQKVVTPKPKPTTGQSAAADQYVSKVTICHHTGSRKHPFVTITISQSALAAHQAHGDTLGPCTAGVLGASATRISGDASGGVLGAATTGSSLPFTGLGLLSVVLLGALTLGTGLALRRSSRA
jgi:hypothetical protein